MKAMLFAEFFKQQFSRAEDIDWNSILNGCESNAFDIDIDEEDVRKAFESMKVNKGEGLNGISPQLLKNCADSLVKPLTLLFRKSLEDGCVPASLKNSRIVPVFKSGSKTNPTNYRAVAIIPTIAKVFEKVMFNVQQDT